MFVVNMLRISYSISLLNEKAVDSQTIQTRLNEKTLSQSELQQVIFNIFNMTDVNWSSHIDRGNRMFCTEISLGGDTELMCSIWDRISCK